MGNKLKLVATSCCGCKQSRNTICPAKRLTPSGVIKTICPEREIENQ
jgi:hypothetical protein